MSLMDEFKKIIHPYDDEDYDYDGEDEFPTQRPAREPAFEDRKEERRSEERRNKVVNIHATTQLKVVLESTSKDIARRLIDFLSGVAYAGDGKIKKVSANTYIITPYSVDLMGDLIDELESSGLYL